MTKKEKHAEGIKFLEQALDAADQADSCFRDAGTRGCIEGRTLTARHHWHGIMRCLESALKSAKEAQCDDCGKALADCQCAWANY
jgi:hypothetical protein